MTERDLSLYDRKALRAALLQHMPEGLELDRSALTRVNEILEASALPGIYSLATLASHQARKNGRQTVSKADVEAALEYIEKHGFTKGEIKRHQHD